MHYFLRHPELNLALVFGPKGASQSLRKWFTDTLQHHEVEPKQVGRFVVSSATLAELEGYHKVLVLRDPLRRLVSFYTNFVVKDTRIWCFADGEQRFPLDGKSFRQLLFVLDHLNRHGLPFQHHLEPQIKGVEKLEFDEIVTVEKLGDGIAGLNRRFGLTAELESINSTSYDSSIKESVTDRSPAWFRQQGLPFWDKFYDDECRALAQVIYAGDLELYQRSAGLDEQVAREETADV